MIFFLLSASRSMPTSRKKLNQRAVQKGTEETGEINRKELEISRALFEPQDRTF